MTNPLPNPNTPSIAISRDVNKAIQHKAKAITFTAKVKAKAKFGLKAKTRPNVPGPWL